MNIATSITRFALVSTTLSFFTIPLDTRADPVRDGEFVFDKETFRGNGRTCVTCHSRQTGTFSIQEAQRRFAKSPADPLFRAPDSDDLDGQSYDRLLSTGTIRIDVPLAANVQVVDDPSARTVAIFRATPTVKNVTTLVEFLMSDGRESTANLHGRYFHLGDGDVEHGRHHVAYNE